MPIKCKDGSKPRYRWKGKVRLAFCGKKVVETKKKGAKAKKVKPAKKKANTRVGQYTRRKTKRV